MQWLDFRPPAVRGGVRIQEVIIPHHSLGGDDPLQSAINAVHDIANTYPAPYTLMLSGGIDSQAMLWAWHQSGIPFRTLTVGYRGFNQHDTQTLWEFVKVNNLSVDMQQSEFDVIEFLEGFYSQYAREYQCSSPHICTYMKMSETVQEGTVIFSGNFVELDGVPASYAILGLKRYAEMSKRSMIPFFFIHSAELGLSFIRRYQWSINNHYTKKTDLYQSSGFPVVPQLTKFTGFEKIKEHYDQFDNRISNKTRIEFADKPSKRVFDLLFRYPYEKEINDPRMIYSFLDKP